MKFGNSKKTFYDRFARKEIDKALSSQGDLGDEVQAQMSSSSKISITPGLEEFVLEGRMLGEKVTRNRILPEDFVVSSFCKKFGIDINELNNNFHFFSAGRNLYFIGKSCGVELSKLRDKKHQEIIDMLYEDPTREVHYTFGEVPLTSVIGQHNYKIHFFISTDRQKSYGASRRPFSYRKETQVGSFDNIMRAIEGD